ncbi:chorismate mutase [bacterium]|nr:chorismate mutase [bacterium]
MNKRLEELREHIFSIDEEIVRLLVKRTETAIEISREKQKLGLPVRDPEREKRVIDTILHLPHAPMHSDDLEMIYRQIIHLSRDAQRREGRHR